MSCPKCGEKDVQTRFIAEGDTAGSSGCRVDNEFIYSSENTYDFTLKAKKDYLRKKCRNCQYLWRENTLDNITEK